MDINRVKLLLNTVKYLRFIQVYYRFYYFFRAKVRSKNYKKKPPKNIHNIQWKNVVRHSNTFLSHNTFSFLNIQHDFQEKIDWNYNGYGKLWTYNLNYFDFLNQKEFNQEDGIGLINNYISSNKFLKDGKEPYPISLRAINWVKFLSEHKVKDEKIDQILYNDYQVLLNNLEYHLLGNHLLENAFSLFFGAYYFQDEGIYKKAKRVLVSQLNEQILKDGGHFELSPMYHQILLNRLLDCIQLIQLNNWKNNDDIKCFLIEKASQMLSWLTSVTYKNGEIPMVNDSAVGIALSSKELFHYGSKLNIPFEEVKLFDSGYRKIIAKNYEFFIDVGNIGVDYQPAHAHSDTFSFELIYKGTPVIVDTGTSTYEKDDRRQLERGTSSHNTVQIESSNQSQVWGGFRVAKRARIKELSESGNKISATHNGYQPIGYLHTRSFQWDEDFVEIKDKISKPTNNKAEAFFHLEAGTDFEIKRGKVFIGDINLEFEGASSIEVKKYHLAKGFNKTKDAQKIIITFDQYLVTKISL